LLSALRHYHYVIAKFVIYYNIALAIQDLSAAALLGQQADAIVVAQFPEFIPAYNLHPQEIKNKKRKGKDYNQVGNPYSHFETLSKRSGLISLNTKGETSTV
jgi:hypothetical protein